MREALNGFVIRGVSSNVPFQAALLAHPKFQSGDFNTGFIAEHYAKGFRAEDVAHEDPGFLVALAAYVNRRVLERSAGISGQMPGHEFKVGEAFVVVQLGQGGQDARHPVNVSEFDQASGRCEVQVAGKRYAITSQWHLGGARIRGHVNGKEFSALVERGLPRNPLAVAVSHNGTRLEALVLAPRAAQLHTLMPFKAPPDMSRYLLSPMPGLLVDVAVQPGQKVQAGERLAVIEAMKMENVLFAVSDGVVGKLLAGKGESLAVDQAILEFQ
jgi:propionyl-CoA carboxylase alpha chain